MTQITVDMTRYWELIDQERKLRHDLFNTNRENFSELLRYQVILENEVYFRQKEDYLVTIEAFLDKTLDGEEFHFLFLLLLRRDRNQVEALEQDFRKKGELTFQTDSEAKRLGKLVNDIFVALETFTDADANKLSEDKFRKKITKIFDKMQVLF